MKRTWVFLFLLPACDAPTLECERDARFEVFADLDGDGFGTGEAVLQCVINEGQADNALDCDDSSAEVYPGATELCNQRDDNCDGQLDEGHRTRTYYADVDGDGFGANFPAVNVCGGAPEGFVNNSDDCDDDNGDINPAAIEVCNGDIDDDCNGLVDDADVGTAEDSKTPFYVDADADGFGNLNQVEYRCEGVAGLVDNFTDCDDRTAAITNYPYPADADLDGYGDEINTVMSCEGYPGTADNRIDCDDSDPWVNIPKSWYNDLDGDGYGTGDPESFGCFPPNDSAGVPLAVGPFSGDCDDTQASINEGATEICDDGIDQNCNGSIDCFDNECAAISTCWGDCVDHGLAAEAPIDYAVPNYKNQGNDYTIPCAYGNGADYAIQWRAPEDGTYEFNTFDSNTRYGPGIALYDGCEENARMMGCNMFSYDRGNGYYQARIGNISLKAGDLVIIKLDSYYGYTDDGDLSIIKQ